MTVQLIQLQYAVEIERCGSITNAARTLFVAQPNLSKSLRELEEELGITIFARTTRGVVPTEAGRKFLLSAKEILQKVEELKSDAGIRGGGQLRLHVTASPYIDCSALMARWLAQCWTEEKNDLVLWDISFEQTDSLCAMERLVDGQSELALLCFPEAYDRFFQQQFTKNQLTAQFFGFAPFQLLLRDGHPLAARQEIDVEQLSGYPRLMLDYSLPSLSVRQRRDASESVPTRRMLRFSDRESALTALSRLPDGYLWFPKASAELLSGYGLCQRGCPQAGNYRMAAVTQSHQQLSRRLKQFRDWIVEQMCV